MLRFQRRPASALMFVLFLAIILPGAVFAGGLAPLFSTNELSAEYAGESAFLLEAGAVEPLSLAAADFDEDGVPDLVVGYGDGADGFFVVHRGNLEAIYPRPGEEAGSAFLPQAQVFATLTRADHIATGDLDADGHFDVATASTGGATLELYRGDGSGRFATVETIELGGQLTAMTVGEVNRRDGLADVVVGVESDYGPKILVFESPLGALRGAPETIDAFETVTSIELGNHDDDFMRDITAFTGSYRIDVKGRDRRLSLGTKRRAEVPDAVLKVEPLSAGSHTTKAAAHLFAGEISGEILAQLSRRLNRDAFPDAVVITDESPVPVVITTLSRATFTVDSIADDPDFSTGDGVCDTDDSVGDGPCTLRAAIEQANASSGADAVEFDIAGSGPHTIQVPSPSLPTITEALTIDGFSQPGAAANTNPFPLGLNATMMIELDGSTSSGSRAFQIEADGCVVRGLVLNGFGNAIYVQAAGDNIIEGNYFGTDTSGTSAAPNTRGVYICGDGCYLTGPNNTVGGTAPGARNLISGGHTGIWAHTADALIHGNFIGTDAAGTAAVPNTFAGIIAQGGSGNSVGGSATGQGNLISGNTSRGVIVWGAADATLQGNLIGPDATGEIDISTGNPLGVMVILAESTGLLIGGTAGTSPGAGCTGACNLISGNMVGIDIDEVVDGATIQGNLIGTNRGGSSALENTNRGISLEGPNTTIGGTAASARNLISGNGGQGIQVWSNSAANLATEILGNFIGTDTTGLAAIPNGAGNDNNGAVFIFKAAGNTIGGTDPGAGNLISGNNAHGVLIDGLEAHSNTISGNSIGLALGGAPLGNALTGVTLLTSFSGADTPSNNSIGGTAAGAGNSIAYNGGDGVSLRPPVSPGGDGNGNAIRGNSIFANTGLGIDLDNDGVTVNDPDDLDEGSNGLQNFPVLSGVTGGGSVVEGAIDSTANTQFHIEFFGNTACDPSGNGEGEVYLGSGTTTTDPSGDAVFSFALSTPAQPGSFVTATATDPDDNTSELSACVEAPVVPDFGDAPDPTYPTLLASDGARHTLGTGLYLGVLVDGEPDGQPNGDATGDDVNGLADEDGVVFLGGPMAGAEETIRVTASASGLLNGWIDFNDDGDWDDPGEQIFTDEPLAAGINDLAVTVPLNAATSGTFSRFRVDSAGGLTPTGLAADGEVEDYAVLILSSTDLEVSIGDSPDPVPEGGLLTYVVSVSNNGQLEATDVELQYTLPPEGSFVSASHTGCSEAGGVVTCALGTVAPGAATEVVIEFDVDFGAVGTISATAEVQTPDPDPIASNDTDVETTTVVDEPTYIFSDGFETGDTNRWTTTEP